MKNGFFEPEDLKKPSHITMMIIVVIIAVFTLCSCTMSKKTTITKILLDGSKSYDPDGYIVSWSWRQVSGPALTIKNKASKKTEAIVNQEASYSFELTVTDNRSGTDKDTTTVVYKKESPKYF